MRVALVVPGGVDRSGEYRVIPALLALLARLTRAHELEVIALAQEREPSEWQLAGARIHNVGGMRYRAVRAARTLWTLHRRAPFDVVHAIWSGSCGIVAVGAGRVLHIPSLVHVAGGELVALPDIAYGGALTWSGRWRERRALRMASTVSAGSAPMVAAIRSFAAVTAQRVPLGVDAVLWPPLAPVRRAVSERARLIHVASLNRVKDQTTLMQALSILQHASIDFQMDVVGEDTLAGAVQELARKLRLDDRVRFHGFLPQRALRPLMEAAHLMIVSSRHEAGPVVVLEAAITGVPTVGTAVGHIAEWAPDAAVAVPVGSPQLLAGAIARVLADEERRLHIARSAFTRALAEDADHTAHCFESLYRQLIGSSSGRY